MFDHLNPITRNVINNILSKTSVILGGEKIESLSEMELRVLYVIALNLQVLADKVGEQLAEHVIDLLKNIEKIPDPNQFKIDKVTNKKTKQWKIRKIRAYSFRGLAPGKKVWEHDFETNSLLLHGPNGSGKSSLLGAICWCLSGRIFRDDCPPSPPETINTYIKEINKISIHCRPDALSLIDNCGKCTDNSDVFWVDVKLISNSTIDNDELWVRRHSIEGLAKSTDGSNWNKIKNIEEAKISELDIELQILMPARVQHIRFGKNPDLIHVFSQIIGYDDLEQMAEVANKAKTAINTIANKLERKDLKEEKETIKKYIDVLVENATQKVKDFPSFYLSIADTRQINNINDLLKNVGDLTEQLNKQLANDLGIEIPEKDAKEYAQLKGQLINLPGQVHNAVKELEKPLSDLFQNCFGIQIPNNAQLITIIEQLDVFKNEAQRQIKERLDWAIEKKKNDYLDLMLIAAEKFSEDLNICPVCGKSLEDVPHIHEQLKDLENSVNKAYLKKEIADLERELIDRLNMIIPFQQREYGEKKLHERLSADWTTQKDKFFPDLLRVQKEKFNDEICKLIENISDDSEIELINFAKDYDEFQEAFSKFNAAFLSALKFTNLTKSFHTHSNLIRRELIKLFKSENDGGSKQSLSSLLERGNSTNDELQTLKNITTEIIGLKKSTEKIKQLTNKINYYRDIARALETIKDFDKLVRFEVFEVLKSVGDQTKVNYSQLYDKEILPFELLTTGHPANPNIKNELNVYANAVNELVPMGPFSNAGRLRALILSFIFALFNKSNETISFIIFDDPALSLDDDHKVRFLDKLIAPLLEKNQIILATHYEKFYKDAHQNAFKNSLYLELTPRRNYLDEVGFEPGDLLKRLETTLNAPTTSWFEKSINLRKWAERTLYTLSSFCPEPFCIYDKFPQNLEAYKKIKDPRINTERKMKIINTFESKEAKRVLNPTAHDDEVGEKEVRDALELFKKCQKDINQEIIKLKAIYQQERLDRAISSITATNIIPFTKVISDIKIKIITEAAGASNGIGISMELFEEITLSGYSVVVAVSDTLSPIVLCKQYLILDNKDNIPDNKDLVIVETEEGRRYLRRFWRDIDNNIILVSTNSTKPQEPIILKTGTCNVRRIIGVIFEKSKYEINNNDNEWEPLGSQPDQIIDNLIGVKVIGTSMAPIALNNQIVLIKKGDEWKIKNGELVCLDISYNGAVIKRCYPKEKELLLLPINPDSPEDPMVISRDDIQHIYPLVGVLFEFHSENIVE